MGRAIVAFIIVASFIAICAPLFMPVAIGGIFAILFYPWLVKLEKHKISPAQSSFILTLGVTLLILLPLSFLIFWAAKSGFQELRHLKDAPRAAGASFAENLVQLPAVHRVIERLSYWFPVGTQELVQGTQELASSIGIRLADLLGGFLASLPGLAMGMFVMVISIYFFLVDGHLLVAWIRRNSVFTAPQTEKLIGSIGAMCRSVILATVISGVVQAGVFGLVCLIAGVNNTGLITLFVFLASFLPILGASSVTIVVTLQQFLAGNQVTGIILLITALVVGVVDNLVRPWVLRDSGQLHPLIAFVSAFGGLQVFGFPGIFLGPIIAGIFVVLLQSNSR